MHRVSVENKKIEPQTALLADSLTIEHVGNAVSPMILDRQIKMKTYSEPLDQAVLCSCWPIK